jgi:Ca-activated chloride channel family protein
MSQALRVALILAAFVGIFAAGAAVGGVVMVHFAKVRFDRLDGDRKEEQRRHQQEQRRLTQISEGLRQQMQRQQQDSQQQRQQLQQLQQQLQQRGGQPARTLPTPEQFGPQLMQRYVNQIQPRASNEQRDKIRPMVNQAAEDLRRLRRDTAHSTELILEKLQDDIAAVLTPQQRDRFTDAIQRWRDTFQKYNAEQQQRQAQARLFEQQQAQRIQQRRQQQQQPAVAKAAGTPAVSSPVPGAPAVPAATPPAPAAPAAGAQ